MPDRRRDGEISKEGMASEQESTIVPGIMDIHTPWAYLLYGFFWRWLLLACIAALTACRIHSSWAPAWPLLPFLVCWALVGELLVVAGPVLAGYRTLPLSTTLIILNVFTYLSQMALDGVVLTANGWPVFILIYMLQWVGSRHILPFGIMLRFQTKVSGSLSSEGSGAEHGQGSGPEVGAPALELPLAPGDAETGFMRQQRRLDRQVRAASDGVMHEVSQSRQQGGVRGERRQRDATESSFLPSTASTRHIGRGVAGAMLRMGAPGLVLDQRHGAGGGMWGRALRVGSGLQADSGEQWVQTDGWAAVRRRGSTLELRTAPLPSAGALLPRPLLLGPGRAAPRHNRPGDEFAHDAGLVASPPSPSDLPGHRSVPSSRATAKVAPTDGRGRIPTQRAPLPKDGDDEKGGGAAIGSQDSAAEESGLEDFRPCGEGSVAVWVRAALVELDSISDFSSALILGLRSGPGIAYTALASLALVQTLVQFVLFNLHGASTPAVRALRMASTVLLDLPMTGIDLAAVVLRTNPGSQSYLVFSFLIKGATMAVHGALSWHEFGEWLREGQRPWVARGLQPPGWMPLAARDGQRLARRFLPLCCVDAVACCCCSLCCPPPEPLEDADRPTVGCSAPLAAPKTT